MDRTEILRLSKLVLKWSVYKEERICCFIDSKLRILKIINSLGPLYLFTEMT